MGKKRRQQQAATPKPAPAPAVEQPAFWFGFEVPWAKLVAGRAILFALLAIDALLAVRHAPRYGAGGFNVAQLPFLDSLGPTRASYAVCQMALAYLFVLVACGVATRIALPIATAIYAWLYFGSQLDSYQHHYLVALLLAIACFIPWQRPAGATARTPIRTWALRLFLVQLAILYLWAAISKMDRAWLDGRALGMQIVPQPDKLIDLRALIDATIGMTKVAKLVLITELGLACSIWLKPAWRFVAPIGILFHVGIVLTGFEIGLFAWIMIAVYAFVIPDRVWIVLAELPPVRAIARASTAVGSRLESMFGIVVGAAGVIVGCVLALVARLDHAYAVGVVAAIATLVLAVRGTRRRMAWLGVAYMLAMLAWTAVDRETTVVTDYYRFWGGSARRLGDTEGATAAYRRLIATAPDDETGHYQLGRLLLPTEDYSAGLFELHEAERLAPARARAFLAEARWLADRGRTDEAIAKANAGLTAEPASKDAKQLVDQLAKGGKLANPAADSDP